MDRTTNATGRVDRMTGAELQTRDAGMNFTTDGGRTFPFRDRGLTILSLDDMLGRYSTVPLLIEVKVVEAASETRRLLERHGCRDRVVIDSAEAGAVAPFRGIFATGASARDVAALLPLIALRRRVTSLPYEAICVPRWYKGLPLPIRGLVRAAQGCGAAVHVWTINAPAVALRLWRAGVNGTVTNDPETMLAARAELD